MYFYTRKLLFILTFVLILYKVISAQAEEINWEWQNPLPQGNPLFSVSMIDSANIIAVGNAGLVMKTTNDGATWEKQFHVGDNMFWFQDVSFPTSTTGYIVGRAELSPDSAIIMRTDDGGLTWNHQHVIGLPERSLNGVYFINQDTGWAVGMEGRILRTTNGGQFWEDQSSPTFGITLERVFFSDFQNGWAVGHWGSIIRTTNGGENWTLSFWHEAYDFYSIHFVNSQLGYVGGVPGILFKTTNGGTNWTPVGVPIGGLIGAIYFFDVNNGIVAGVEGKILMTTDGGENWTLVHQMSYNDLIRRISFVDNNNGIAVGHRGALLRTYDGGSTWTKWHSEISDIAAFWGVCFATSEIGIVAGDGGIIYRTANAGATWSPVSVGQSPVFREVSFADSNTGAVVGRYGVILRTTDAGITWTHPQLNQATQQLFDVKFVTSQLGFAVGENNIAKTTDAGNTWYAQPYNGAGWVIGVCFLDSLTGFTVDYGGLIKKTTNSGLTWEPIANLQVPLRRISFANSQIGIAVGGVGTIVRTSDGGNTWVLVRQTASSMMEELWDTQFSNENTAYAVGPFGILKSTDAGLNWFREKSGANTIHGIHFYDEDIGIAVGHNGAILKTRTGTMPVFFTNQTEIIFQPTTPGATTYENLIVANTGNAPLVIQEVLSNSEHFNITPKAVTISPGQNQEFIVSFTPDSIQHYTGLIVFNHNASSSPDTILVIGDGITSIANYESAIPKEFYLHQNYPNPFNPKTIIRFDLPKESFVVLTVYNVLGQRVATLIENQLSAGYHEVVWDASQLSSGIYLFKIAAQEYSMVRKGILIR